MDHLLKASLWVIATDTLFLLHCAPEIGSCLSDLLTVPPKRDSPAFLPDVPLNHGNVPLFVRSRIFLHAQSVTLPRGPDVNANHPIERDYGNSVQFLAKIPNGTAAESQCYSVFWNAIDFCRLYTSKKNSQCGPCQPSRLAGLVFLPFILAGPAGYSTVKPALAATRPYRSLVHNGHFLKSRMTSY